MSYVFANPNPDGKLVDDCVFRALSIVLDSDWEDVFAKLSVLALMHHDKPDANYVWADLIESNGFKRHILPDTCPNCYKVRDFVRDYPTGTYLLGTGTHVVAVKDGNYYDTFDSGDYVPVYYWAKEFYQPALLDKIKKNSKY